MFDCHESQYGDPQAARLVLLRTGSAGWYSTPYAKGYLEGRGSRLHTRSMTNTDEALRRLIDEAGIRDAFARFGMAATLGDVGGLRELWTDDSVWTIGAPANHTAQGVDDIAAMYEGLRAGNDYFVQLTTPGAVTIDGDTATVRSLCQEFASGPNERYYRTTGIWNDRLRRTDAGWRFVERTWQYLWVDYSPYSGQTFAVES